MTPRQNWANAQVLVLCLATLAAAQYAPKYDAPAYPKAYPSYGAPAPYEEKPQPYSFGYDAKDEYGATLNRKEESDDYGNKRGSYGYTDGYGIYRQVDYVADDKGFRAVIKTNEPGTENQNAADAEIHSDAAPIKYEPAPAYGKPYGAAAPAYSKPAPIYKPAPAYAPAPAYKPAPAYAPAPAYKPAPAYAPAPAYKPAPAYAPEPAYKPTPAVYAPAPVYKPAPAYAPAPIYDSAAPKVYSEPSYAAPAYPAAPAPAYEPAPYHPVAPAFPAIPVHPAAPSGDNHAPY
ncbi:UNVERIFIED_CONTAM: Cuticle protein 16.8 [Trichonephila clavipes]